ncbi:uncharacterized protein LOC119322064 isoform X2 [Triticum dicoccoides]|uniref:uncharacterized protein LOC119322064 isoform X2 n=1 Tax=Triticum dicoccoides TaxID=85692 RepID=UPI00189135F1|nr:uncharacterized protein LOC119322064 isoform X2 [Triticum dicoccoides]
MVRMLMLWLLEMRTCSLTKPSLRVVKGLAVPTMALVPRTPRCAPSHRSSLLAAPPHVMLQFIPCRSSSVIHLIRIVGCSLSAFQGVCQGVGADSLLMLNTGVRMMINALTVPLEIMVRARPVHGSLSYLCFARQ